MSELDEARRKINEIDAKMAKLFEARMDAVRDVAQYKIENGLTVLDASREEAVIQRNIVVIEDEEIREYYPVFMRGLFEISKSMQRKMMSGARVAYCGVPGAFAYDAASTLFEGANMCRHDSFEDAYNATYNGDCDFAVLPLENSTEGEVGQVMDLIFCGSLYINGVYDFSVTQNLVALPGAVISDIKTVLSHPQALAQCSEYIKENGFASISETNTAAAAKKVAENKDISVAAIASESAARMYGLKILASSINHNKNNTTRFAVFSRHENAPRTSDDHFIIVFTAANSAGSLASALAVIGKYGYNLRTLRSRPMKGLLWKYYFYAEVEGNINSESGREMLKELSPLCDKLKVAGSFTFTGKYM